MPPYSRPLPPPLPLSDELLAKAFEPPIINTSPLPEYDYDRLDYGMTIGLERTPGGRLWACWVGGGDSELGYFVLATSDDDGETWSHPRVVIDPHSPALPCARRTLVGALWTDPQGRLWLFFDQSLAYFDGRAGDWYTRCDNPDDENPTWTAPQRIWHGATLNKPTVLADGDWLLPISLWLRERIDHRFSGLYADLDNLRMANIFASSDQGRTWQRRGGVKFPYSEFDEHMIVQRRDGGLWTLGRTRNDLWESTSTDLGRTWSQPRHSGIGQISARYHLRRLRSGRLLLIKHGTTVADRTPQRTHLTAYLSDDDGMSWQGGLLLDERFQVSYPDGTQGTDGTIYVSYDRNRDTDGEVLLARFTEEDILARKCVSPQSRLKMLVSRPLGKRR